MKTAPLILTVIVLVGCATQSGVVQTSSNTFLATKQAATGFPGLGNLKAEVIQEAGTFCANLGGIVRILKTNESKPPYVMGNYPRVEVEFACEYEKALSPSRGQQHAKPSPTPSSV